MEEAEARSRLERMVAASSAPALTSSEVDDLLEIAARKDEYDYVRGDEGWIPTWNLAAAAAVGWEWKKARAAGGVDFSADGSSMSLSQLFKHCDEMRAYYGQVAGMSGESQTIPVVSRHDNTYYEFDAGIPVL